MKLVATVVSLAIATAAGCGANPATNRQRTNEPLRVVVTQSVSGSTGSHLELSKDSYSGVTRVDRVSDGHYTMVLDWKYYLGDTEIDEHDYFRLSGDTKAADKIHRERVEMIGMRRKMAAVTLVSLAAVVGSVVLISAGGGIPEEMYDANGPFTPEASTMTKTGAVIFPLAVIVGGIGGLLWHGSNKQVAKPRRIDDWEAAKTASHLVDFCVQKDGTRTPGCEPQINKPNPGAAPVDPTSLRVPLKPRAKLTMRY